MGQRNKYILLENLEDDKNQSCEVPLGEILEEVQRSDIWSSDVALFDARRRVELTCPSKNVARLTDVEADDLMKIKSPDERLAKFQATKCFRESPKIGDEVFVVVKRRELKGIVRAVDNSSSFGYGVQFFDEVELEEHCIQDGTFKICSKIDVLFRLPNGGIGVFVCSDKLRPRNERKEPIPRYRTNSVSEEIEVEMTPRHSYEKGIQEDKTNELETKLLMETIEQQNYKNLDLKTTEIRRQLACELKVKEEAEKQLQKSEEITKELEAKLNMAKLEQQYYEKVELKLNNLRERLACKEKACDEAEKRLQLCEERNTDLKTDLAMAQKLLKRKEEPENECEWNLNREEIHLTTEELGKGAFGTVYKGMFRGTQVAVKALSVKPKITDYNIKNFRREMRMASRCRHPCMLQFIGATSDDQSPLLVTELLDKSLKMVLLERALDPTEITTIALDVAKGLNYLHLNHPQPIVHRDISSANVLLWKHGQSWRGKISDYGNAVMMNYARTGSGGAIPYLAPEMDNQKFSTKSDVYSYGVLLLEMYRRDEPSCRDDRDEHICLLEDESMRNLVRRCLRQDPARRPSMVEVLYVLNSENL